jgi:hypothetical protein
MIEDTNFEVIKRKIKGSEKRLDILARDDNFNRKLIEYGKIRSIVGIEMGKRGFSLKNIDSGFNSVLGKIASKNNVSIGVDIDSYRALGKKDKAVALMKLIQNIKLARKTKTRLILFNFFDKKNSESLLISLGASTRQSKESLDF